MQTVPLMVLRLGFAVLGLGLVAAVPGGCQPPGPAQHDVSFKAAVVGSALTTSTSRSPTTATVAPQPLALPSSVASAVSSEVEPTVLADTDPNNDGEVAPPEPLVGCEDQLTMLGAVFSPTKIALTQKRGDVFTCGADQVVIYRGRSSSPRYNTAPRLTCRMALGLVQFEDVAQELAEKYLNSAVRRVEQGGTYSCRKMARFADMVSEHSYANAIDVRSFQLQNGRTISVKRHFGALTAGATTAENQFLRELASRLYDDGVFSVVLTPYFDRLHHDHFHFDQARYRVDGTRAQ